MRHNLPQPADPRSDPRDSSDAPLLSVPYVSYGGAAEAEAQAAKLFDALREIDTKGKKKAIAHAPSSEGVGLAVYNRLLRACAFKVKEI